MEQGGSVAIPGLACELTWTQKELFRANRLAAGNARRYTHLPLTARDVCVDVKDAALVGGVLMANAVAYSGVPAYAEIPKRWTLHRSGALLIEVQDARRDFPDFDEITKWEPAEGERARSFWSARRLGAEIAYASSPYGKSVQAMIAPPDASINAPAVPHSP
ncbi:hypothetical protein [Streptomyces canus]|uniref:hypothetical protein n=1 Tax=Streptomyces canus TaxID=58343 RepID=UPI00225A9008|nr:hypothetical protein [Streptomyces canus]MCX4858349.1 hypothetical protein [Streptomyces canus]